MVRAKAYSLKQPVRVAPLAILLLFGMFLFLRPAPARADCLPPQVCPPGVPTPPTPLPSSPADQVGKAVGDAANQAQQAVGSAANQISGAVNGIVHPPGSGGGGPGQGGGGPSGGSGGSNPGGQQSTGGAGSNGAVTGSTGILSTFVSSNSPDRGGASSDHPGVLGGVGGTVLQVAGQLGFPIALAVAVLMFAMIQQRLDRKDHRLVLAPATPAVVRFE